MKKQKLTLVQSDTCITIIDGETPVIGINGSYHELIPMIVNFLRCGCPSVQLIMTYDADDWDERYLSKFEENLNAIQLSHEKFEVAKNFPIMTVTRNAK